MKQILTLITFFALSTSALASGVSEPCKTALTDEMTRQTETNQEFLTEKARAKKFGGDLVIKGVSLSVLRSSGSQQTIVGKVFFADPREDDFAAFERFKFIANTNVVALVAASRCQIQSIQKELW